jgi:hypothetical protein
MALAYRSDGFSAYVSENLGKLFFFVGALLSFIGVVTANEFGTLLSAVSLFSGILLLFFGLFSMLGLFSSSWRSISGAGMLSICVAIAFFAFAVVALEFLEVVSTTVAPIFFKSAILGYQVFLNTDRVYVWVSDLCFKTGLGFLVFGVGLKIADMLRR